MRKIQSTPKDRAFYNEHGASLKAYNFLANLGQLLSGSSLALAIFSILRDALAGQGITTTSGILSAAAALIGLFVELANRLLARPSLRPLVLKNQFADQPEKQQRHKLLTRLSRAGLFVVGGLSLFLSWRGSMDAGQLVTEAPATVNADSLASNATARLNKITLTFAADTTTLLAPYNQRTAAANQQFNATAAERSKAAQDYYGCADGGNKWCKKQRRARLAEIDAARATLAATLASIATERGATLAAAINRRDAAVADATARADAALSEAELTYQEASSKAEAKASSTGYIFAVLTLIGQLVFYLMTYLVLQIKAGSEIREDLQPNEFHNQPSVLADLRAVVNHRVERGARRLIAKVFGERDRLDGTLPYVQVWESPEVPTPADGTAVASAAADQSHAPGFYRKADDPHTNPGTPNSRVTFNTPTPPPHTKPSHTNNTAISEEAKVAQTRLNQYRKRLGEHTQKAKAQERKHGTIKSRTAKAIANNQQWVNHYTQLLNDLQ